MFVTGDITEITAVHPTLGTFTYQAKTDAEFNYHLVGVRYQDDDDGISGAGEFIDMKRRERWFIEGPILWDMNSRNELDSLTKMSESTLPATWTISCINGSVYGGTGIPVGPTPVTNKGEITAKIAGGGKLSKIS